MRAFDNSTPNVPNHLVHAATNPLAWHALRGTNYGPCAPHSHEKMGAMLETLFILSELAVEDVPEH